MMFCLCLPSSAADGARFHHRFIVSYKTDGNDARFEWAATEERPGGEGDVTALSGALHLGDAAADSQLTLSRLLNDVLPAARWFMMEGLGRHGGCVSDETPLYNAIFSPPYPLCNIYSHLVNARNDNEQSAAMQRTAATIIASLSLPLAPMAHSDGWVTHYLADKALAKRITRHIDSAYRDSGSLMRRPSASPQVALYRALRRLVARVLPQQLDLALLRVRAEWPCDLEENWWAHAVRTSLANRLLHVYATQITKSGLPHKEVAAAVKLLIQTEFESALVAPVASLVTADLLAFLGTADANVIRLRREEAEAGIRQVTKQYGFGM